MAVRVGRSCLVREGPWAEVALVARGVDDKRRPQPRFFGVARASGADLKHAERIARIELDGFVALFVRVLPAPPARAPDLDDVIGFWVGQAHALAWCDPAASSGGRARG